MIKTYSTLQIGSFHTNHCEDFRVTAPIATNQQLIAVMDGCTMGNESAFASMLFGKVLRNIAKQFYYEDFLFSHEPPLEQKVKFILKMLFDQISLLKNQLGLDTHELLSTLILGVVDTAHYQAELIILGDGIICHDAKIIVYEQDDKPDYLAYHIGTPFESWYAAQSQKLSIYNFRDLSISTDGITTFKNFTTPQYQKSANEIINYLLIDDGFSDLKNFLDRKLRFINEQWQHEVTDDLAIIRMIKQQP